jgi:hypothetical protein
MGCSTRVRSVIERVTRRRGIARAWRARNTAARRLGVGTTIAGMIAITTFATFGAGGSADVAEYTGCLRTVGSSNGTVYALAPGTTPLVPCKASEIEIHISGGDITDVVAGIGLEGGTSNGTATLSLQSSYRLPQACSAGAVAKWTGTTWTCSTDNDSEPRAYGGYSAVYANGAGIDLPDDQASLGKLPLPAGSYAIFAKLDIKVENPTADVLLVQCHLNAESDVDTGIVSSIEADDQDNGVISLNALHEFASDGFAEVTCDDAQAFDPDLFTNAKWSNLRITAIRLGNFTNQPLMQ